MVASNAQLGGPWGLGRRSRPDVEVHANRSSGRTPLSLALKCRRCILSCCRSSVRAFMLSYQCHTPTASRRPWFAASTRANEHGALRSALPLSSPRGHRGALARQGGARSSHCLPGSGLLTGLTWDRVGSFHCSFAGSLGCGRQESYRRSSGNTGRFGVSTSTSMCSKAVYR